MKTTSPSQALLPLRLADWRATRDSLHDYALVLGTIRRLLAPAEPHWAHVSLCVVHDGLTTTPMPITTGHLEIRLNLQTHQLECIHLQGKTTTLALTGQPQAALAAWLLEELRPLHSALATAKLPNWNKTERPFAGSASIRFGQVLAEVAAALEDTRLHVPGRLGALQLWPHHFDLAFLWFSGQKVPGKDPTDLDNADEQVNLGFVTGDDSIPEAYFYATAYPEPPGLADLGWPAPGRWHDKGWHGVVADYRDFLEEANPAAALADWLGQVHAQLRSAVLSQR